MTDLYKGKNLVSVIVPAYNTGQYVGRCITSILGQSYSNLEIIVVDDGSTDDTENIVLMYAQKDSRVKLIRQENQGVARARNRGIAEAKGNYISFVDSDDYIKENFIGQLLGMMLHDDSEIAICGIQKEKAGAILEKIPVITKSETIDTGMLGNKFDNDSVPFSSVNKMYKREIIADKEFPNLSICEDVVFNAYIFPISKKVSLNSGCLYVNVQRPESLTRKGSITSIKQIDEHLYAVEKLRHNVLKNSDDSTTFAWSMLAGRLIFELTIALLLEKNIRGLSYLCSQPYYHELMKKLDFNSTKANIKKKALFLLLKCHFFRLAIVCAGFKNAAH